MYFRSKTQVKLPIIQDRENIELLYILNKSESYFLHYEEVWGG